ncbi:PAS domain S-box protein [Paenibacillus mesophilus]|uniref:PAS domain S-box protein n=1 Tax=Paenibacillus mesophilus TaxID=2582849 RepID=UPI00110DEDE5|nr:PAS domain S-box protein [Paenibacillus mesophilus]TMV49671.1 PAS domain S-box protein [Paenibacillus mesophilus]
MAKTRFDTSTFGSSPKSDRAAIEREWEKFMSGSSSPLLIRSFMHHSWKRCMEQGVNPLLVKASYNLGLDQIEQYVTSDPLFRMVEPFLKQLKQLASNTGYLISYCNSAGEMIYYDGDRPLMLKAEDIHFTPGSDWSEGSAGTNAIGTALVTGMPLQVYASEHFCQEIHSWTCSAAPIRDPSTGNVLGIIDLTGFWTVNDPKSLDVVVGAAHSIEKILYGQLKMERYRLAQHFAQLTKKTTQPIAVLDRGGRVIKASRTLYDKGWISPKHWMEHTSFIKQSFPAKVNWEIERDRKRWLFELSPYFYGGVPIGSIVTVLPPDIAAFADLPDIRHTRTAAAVPGKEEVDVEPQPAPPRDLFYKSLFDHHPDAIFSYDLQGALIDANPAAETMLGFSAKELKNKKNLIPPEYKESRLRAFANAASGIQQMYEAAFMHKLGHSVYASLKAFPIIADNRIVGVYETVRDIAPNHQQIQEDLKTTKEQLEFYFRNTEDAILVVDANFHVVKANKSYERVYGWTEQELLGRELPTIPDHLKQEAVEIRGTMLTSRHVIPYETVRQRKDGTLIHVSNFASPLFDSKGNAIAYVLISRDVTELKRMAEKLIGSEKRLRTLINAMPDLVIFKDDQGRWIEANEFARASLQLKGTDYIGMTDFELGERDAFYRDMYSQCALSDQMAWDKGSLIRIQETIPNPDGSVAICDLIKVPIYHTDGRRKGLVVIGRDITELKQTEHLLRKTEKLAVVGQLAAGIAHEIRNPLTTLKGFLSLMRSHIKDKDRWYLEVMLAEIEKMEWSANQFLAVAKPQSAKFERRSLETAIRHVSSFLYPLAKMHNVKIVIQSECGDPHVECDENLLKQAFINIVKNAIEAMPQGGQVVIRIERAAESVSVRVIDHGHGIPQDRLPHLGEPFYSLKERGTGLGLMICYKIMKEHRGTLHFTSEVGRGTTVEIRLPLGG